MVNSYLSTIARWIFNIFPRKAGDDFPLFFPEDLACLILETCGGRITILGAPVRVDWSRRRGAGEIEMICDIR